MLKNTAVILTSASFFLLLSYLCRIGIEPLTKPAFILAAISGIALIASLGIPGYICSILDLDYPKFRKYTCLFLIGLGFAIGLS